MTVCYLDADDEITTAIARIRAVRDGEVVVVVPPGSRIATSRINFRLLAREAIERKLTAVAVTDEPAVRALAIAAGLPAYDTLAAAEQALTAFRTQDRDLAERLGRGDAPRRSGTQAGQTMVLPLPPDQPSPTPRRGGVPTETAVLPPELMPAREGSGASRSRGRRRGSRAAPMLVIGLLALLLAGVAYGAYAFLPTASVTLRPASARVSAPAFTVTADPDVAVVDAEAGMIPAELVTMPLRVEGEFPATGIEARETRASGIVRFRSENTLNAVPIPAQTVVATADGVEFVTQEAVTVPRASFATGPASAEVAVRAVRAGTDGNVDANEVTRLPAAIQTQLVTVRNPAPMTGGRRLEEALVTQEDYDAAVADLTSRLEAALTAALADPDNIPRGLVAFASTAEIEDPQVDQPAAALVDTVTPTFALGIDAQGRVVAVNEALIEDVARQRIADQVAAGHVLVGESTQITSDDGTVVGDSVAYQVTAQALAYTQPSVQDVLAAVRGKPLSEAQRALAGYGEADVSVWPDFIDRLPDQAARISVTIIPPGSST